jgi:streptogramin lyase
MSCWTPCRIGGAVLILGLALAAAACGSTTTGITPGGQPTATPKPTSTATPVHLQGLIKEFSLPSGRPAGETTSYLQGLVVGPDGNLWFTETDAGKVGRITLTGRITEFSVLLPGSQDTFVLPTGLVAGPDGNLWFTETLGNLIGRLTPTGVLTEFPVGAPSYFDTTKWPDGLMVGPDGNLWFTEINGNMISRIIPTGVITDFAVPTGRPGEKTTSHPERLVVGPDHNLWFIELVGNKIGQVS